MPATKKRSDLTADEKSESLGPVRSKSSRRSRTGESRSPAVPAKLEIRYLAIDDLAPYGRNPRTHAETQIATIANSMTEFGFTNPILVDEKRTIIAGHGRLLAARKLGMEQVPTITLAGLSAAQRKALVVADNQIALNSAWDLDLLRSELGDLRASGFDLSLTGFSDLQLTDLFSVKTGLVDADEVPALDPTAIARVGDVWLLGAHRLACGDSTNPQAVKALLGADKPHLCATDPPYGVEYDADWRNRADRANGKPYGASAVGRVTNDERVDWSAAWALFPGTVFYCWHADRHASAVQQSLEQAGFEIRCQIVWVKQNIVISRGHYHWKHEPCWYAVRKGSTGHWQGDRKQTTVWEIDKPLKSETGHSTQKPVECMQRPIENNSKPGEQVYDPFSGSFTTGIACEMTGRACLAMEISPLYVDLGVRRWQQFTGRKATLQGTRKTFGQIAEDRVGRRE